MKIVIMILLILTSLNSFAADKKCREFAKEAVHNYNEFHNKRAFKIINVEGYYDDESFGIKSYRYVVRAKSGEFINDMGVRAVYREDTNICILVYIGLNYALEDLENY